LDLGGGDLGQYSAAGQQGEQNDGGSQNLFHGTS
jgi:hypothetical protein